MYLPYKRHPSFILGFHGCDKSIGEEVLSGRSALKASDNPYDWLGKGIYFWEGNPTRAMQFAKEAVSSPHTTRGHIKVPFVIGAIVDLGLCCNLHDQDTLDELRLAAFKLRLSLKVAGISMPENHGGTDQLLRNRDCAVINFLHQLRKKAKLPGYQSVRATFQEGGELYSGSGFTRKSHIQVAVRDSKQILGYFRPRAD